MEEIEILDKVEFKHSVDIPQMSAFGGPSDEFRCVAEFSSREDAIAYAKEHFGADDNGMVCLVSSW